MKYLTLCLANCLFFCGSTSLLAELYVAAPNSPDRIKQKADIVCDGRAADDELQAACDLAFSSRDVLVLATGEYRIENTVRAKCGIRGEGAPSLLWTGEDLPLLKKKSQPPVRQWILTVEGRSPRYSCNVSGIFLRGRYKAGGLLVRGVHRATISDVHCVGTKGGGIRIEDGWCLFVRNVSCVWGDGPAFEAYGFTRGVLDGFTATHMKANAPMVHVTGSAGLRQLAIEDCESGDSPVILLEGFYCGKFDGLHSERVAGSSIIHVKDTEGATVKSLNLGNRNVPIGVLVTGSERVLVDNVVGWGMPDAVVRFDYASHTRGCRHDRIREKQYAGRPKAKHIIDYAGQGN